MLIISIILILLVSFVFTSLAHKLHFSEVIGLIFSGLLISFYFKSFFNPDFFNIIESFSYMGLFFLMFISGLEVSLKMIIQEEYDALVISFFSFISSFLLAFFVFRILLEFSFVGSAIIGICLGITAEATKVKALLELKKIKSKIGSILIGAGIINDFIGVFLLSIITYFFTHNFSSKEIFVLLGTLGFFSLGVFVRHHIKRNDQRILLFEKLLQRLIIPFFFVNLGVSFVISQVNWSMLVLLIFVCIVGQLIGSFASHPITKLRPRQLFLIGMGMNSKGAVEMVIAFIALELALISESVYSTLIVSSLILTIGFQFFIFGIVKKYPNIMD
jgi:Kef-type K+ transport system membrane component KefB